MNLLVALALSTPAELPSLSDPHIPLVAREIMQRMIRQFAAEYTSKNTQDAPPPPLPPNGAMKDQSPPPCSLPAPCSPPSSASCSSPSPCLSPPDAEGGATVAASAQNPVLSKLLMADQDGPLDLTVKKNPGETETPAQQGELRAPNPAAQILVVVTTYLVGKAVRFCQLTWRSAVEQNHYVGGTRLL